MFNNYWLQSWSFHELRTFVEYKAALAGIPVEVVDAAYTSRTCPKCGREEKGNRPTQDKFECQSCQHSAHADVVGALNVSIGGVVNRPEFAPERVG